MIRSLKRNLNSERSPSRQLGRDMMESKGCTSQSLLDPGHVRGLRDGDPSTSEVLRRQL